MKVSILEQSVSVEGKPQSVTIKDSINLAKKPKNLVTKDFGFQNTITILQLLGLHLKY